MALKLWFQKHINFTALLRKPNIFQMVLLLIVCTEKNLRVCSNVFSSPSVGFWGVSRLAGWLQSIYRDRFKQPIGVEGALNRQDFLEHNRSHSVLQEICFGVDSGLVFWLYSGRILVVFWSYSGRILVVAASLF